MFSLIVFAVIVVIALVDMPLCSSSYAVTGSQGVTQASAKARTKLPASECKPIAEWYEDLAEWIDDPSAVTTGMKRFYDKTGVQPYLIITTSIEGDKDYNVSQVESYMRARYDELFGNDDGHLILLFCEPYDGEYDPYLLVGRNAQKVIDVDAEDIIYGAIDTYYSDTSLSNSKYFGKIFSESADDIMAQSGAAVTPSPSSGLSSIISPVITTVAALGCAGVLAFFIVRYMRSKAQSE